MNHYYSPLFRLRILTLVFNILFSVQCQICNLDHGDLPQGWKCDDEPHILSKDQVEIANYCGYNISSILPKKLTHYHYFIQTNRGFVKKHIQNRKPQITQEESYNSLLSEN